MVLIINTNVYKINTTPNLLATFLYKFVLIKCKMLYLQWFNVVATSLEPVGRRGLQVEFRNLLSEFGGGQALNKVGSHFRFNLS